MPWGSDHDYIMHSNVLHPSLQQQLCNDIPANDQPFNCYAERQDTGFNAGSLFTVSLILGILTTTPLSSSHL